LLFSKKKDENEEEKDDIILFELQNIRKPFANNNA